MRPKKTWARIEAGSFDIRFEDLVLLALAFGFVERRRSGSHRIFNLSGVPELLNLQPVGSNAKPYQIKQLVALVRQYGLRLEDE